MLRRSLRCFRHQHPPILDGYRADPDIRVFGDTYYIYPTSDKTEWNTTDFSCWSSKDLIHWKNEGIILDVTHHLSWVNLKVWAPHDPEHLTGETPVRLFEIGRLDAVAGHQDNASVDALALRSVGSRHIAVSKLPRNDPFVPQDHAILVIRATLANPGCGGGFDLLHGIGHRFLPPRCDTFITADEISNGDILGRGDWPK